MDIFKKTKKLFITLLLVCISMLVIDVAVFFVIKSKNEKISIAENELAVAIDKNNHLRSLKTLLGETGEERKLVESFFIKSDEVVDFLDSLNTLGREIGVELLINDVEVITLAAGDSKYFEELKLNIQADGSWGNVFRFFSLLETLPYALTWKRASLERLSGLDSGTSGWQGVFDVTFVKLK